MQRTLTPMKTRSRQFIAQHFKENVDPLGLAANAGSVFLFDSSQRRYTMKCDGLTTGRVKFSLQPR
jgi:hypothetical protein